MKCRHTNWLGGEWKISVAFSGHQGGGGPVWKVPYKLYLSVSRRFRTHILLSILLGCELREGRPNSNVWIGNRCPPVMERWPKACHPLLEARVNAGIPQAWIPVLKPWCRTCLVAQWVRICLSVGTWARSLVWEVSARLGATEPVCPDCWARALEAISRNHWGLHPERGGARLPTARGGPGTAVKTQSSQK